MRRREFIGLIGSAAMWPLEARAQSAQRAKRVTVLFGIPQAEQETKRQRDILLQGLRELGWVEGRNIQFDYHDGFDAEASRMIAQQVVDRAPDLIVAQGNVFVAALRAVKSAIPTVFVQVSDPVTSGYVESLTRPGGNMTGFTNFESEIGGKWVQTLKEAAPDVSRALFLHHPQTAANVAFLRTAEAAGPGLVVAVIAAGVRNAEDIERAITNFTGQSGGGLIIAAHVIFGPNFDLIGGLATQHRLPSIFPFRNWMVRAGGLLSYGIDGSDQFRRAAPYVDRVLRGARPGDLPIQNPIHYELAVNAKTAKALGLTVPPTLLARADEVIE